MKLCRAYSRSDRTIEQETSRARNPLHRRAAQLADAAAAGSCVAPLEPDLVILDEFQRFSHLLDDSDDDASLLAKAVFNYPGVRVLLLSATPYKMYTLTDDGEDHYSDFVRTIRFLEARASGERADRRARSGGVPGGPPRAHPGRRARPLARRESDGWRSGFGA